MSRTVALALLHLYVVLGVVAVFCAVAVALWLHLGLIIAVIAGLAAGLYFLDRIADVVQEARQHGREAVRA